MQGGYETYSEKANKLVVQKHWGATTSEIVEAATAELIDRLNAEQAVFNLNLVSETEVEFSPAALIQSIEAFKSAAPQIRRMAYVIDPDRHAVEEMLIKTVAWNLGVQVGFFPDEAEARAFLLDHS